MQGSWGQNRPKNNKQDQAQGFLDFNKIDELPSKYPRAELPEDC
jgi:hypothetical protein